MSNQAYARSVVTQVLYGSAPWRWIWPWSLGARKWIWEGNKSSLIWFLTAGWAWVGVFQFAMARMFNMEKLRKAYQKQVAEK
jgi:1-acylglycerone phosphate reductase